MSGVLFSLYRTVRVKYYTAGIGKIVLDICKAGKVQLVLDVVQLIKEIVTPG